MVQQPAPCHFCEGKAKHYEYQPEDTLDQVVCLECGASTGHYEVKGQALKVWNKVWHNFNA